MHRSSDPRRAGDSANQARALAYGEEGKRDARTRRFWPTVAIVATYKYVSEGVRILGRAYTTYDDRSPQ